MIDIYETIAPSYNKKHAHWLKHAGGEGQAAFEACVLSKITPQDRLLDAGCGTGAFARYLQSFKHWKLDIFLLDACQNMLAQTNDIEAQKKLGCLCENPYQSDQFDLVTAAWSLETSPDTEIALQELYRVLKPGGTMVLVFCSTKPTDRLLAKLLRSRVKACKTGRFLDPALVIENAQKVGLRNIIEHRCEGPATVLSLVKPLQPDLYH